ncbi:MAG: hypothetical protein U0172_05035 [Nitrospiraceae bacterium]
MTCVAISNDIRALTYYHSVPAACNADDTPADTTLFGAPAAWAAWA